MNITPDIFVGAIVTAVLVLGATVVGSRTLKASFAAEAKQASFKQAIYRVSWPSFAVGYSQFAIAALPIVILALSSNPGTAGYIVFGGAALAWGCFGAWYLRKLNRTYLEFTDSHLVYFDGRHSKTLPYGCLRSVLISSGHIVCLLDAGEARFAVPLQFSSSEMILARLRSVCEERANQTAQTTPGLRPSVSDL